MSIKLDRIESNMIKEISYILANEVKDKDIRFVREFIRQKKEGQ